MKHVKLFEQFLNEKLYSKKLPGYAEGLETIKTQKSLVNYLNKSKKALESLPKEPMKAPIKQQDRMNSNAAEYGASINSALNNGIVQSLGASVYVNPVERTDRMAQVAQIEFGFDELRISIYQAEQDDKNGPLTSKELILINYDHTVDVGDGNTYAKDHVLTATNADAVNAILKDPKFIKLLQNHVNACNLFNTASM